MTRTGAGSVPVPDPTELTDKAIAKEATARDASQEFAEGLFDAKLAIRDERLSGMDEATKLRLQTIDHIPATMDEKVAHAREIAHLETTHQREVSDIRFTAAERLAGRESELNALALAAAFAANKEAASKSETATAEAIAKIGQLFDRTIAPLADKVDDVRTRIGTVESTKSGATEQRDERRQSNTALYALIGVVATILGIALTIATIVAALKP